MKKRVFCTHFGRKTGVTFQKHDRLQEVVLYMFSLSIALTAKEVNSTRGLSEFVEIRKEIDFHYDAQFSPYAMHRIVDGEPSTDHCSMFPHQQWI